MSTDAKGATGQLLHDPWLVAAWPGVGAVAALAAGHMVQALGARPAGSLAARDYFELDHVDVSLGIARPGHLPRSLFYLWRDPKRRHDLLLFLGEAQPHLRGWAMCRRIMDVAAQHGVRRVVSFAALVTTRRPAEGARVFAAVSAPELLAEIRGAGVELMRDGRIGGLNGALLAAAAERSVPAMCLLGEVPQLAAGIPNPRSALAALETFAILSGIEIDLDALRREAAETDTRIAGLLEALREGEPAAAAEGPTWEDGAAAIDPNLQQRIDELFEEARRDRSKVSLLKQELDRLGLFHAYEDRFLDLFREP